MPAEVARDLSGRARRRRLHWDDEHAQVERVRPSPARRPHDGGHRCQQRHRPVAAHELARAGAHVVLAVRDTAKGGPGGRRDARRPQVRRLDLADLASVRAFADAWEGELDVLINNAGVMAVPRAPHPRRLRAAVRHQPPRPLRPDQPPAAARHRPRRDRRERRAPHRPDRLRRPVLGAPALPALARLRAVQACQPPLHARTATAADRAGSAGASRRRAPGLGRDQPPKPHREPAPGRRHGARQPALAQSDEMGALPTLYAATQDVPAGAT